MLSSLEEIQAKDYWEFRGKDQLRDKKRLGLKLALGQQDNNI